MEPLAAEIDASPRVLIVDRSVESLQVLQTVLHRRGVQSVGSRRARKGLELAYRLAPRLIVLDEETISASHDVGPDYVVAARTQQAQLVVLGHAGAVPAELPASQVVAKPYQYGALIRKIEALLETHRAA